MSKKQLTIPLFLLASTFFFYFLVVNYTKLTSGIPKKATESLMPKFRFSLFNDSEFTQDNLVNKDVVFYFFSPDCGECNKMSKKICELAGSFPELQFLMVSNESKGVILKYFNKLPCNSVKVLIDKHDYTTNIFSITSIPTIMIYKKGVLTERIIGNVKLSFIKEKIQN